MSEKKTNEVEKVKKDITVKVLEKINSFKESGELTIPKDYSPENALKSAYLVLSETVDKEKRPVLESCTQASIANALLQMITMGLSVNKGQVYFIAYAGKLTIMKSYMGNMAIAKRVAGLKSINANVICKGDVFEYGVNLENGELEIKKHETSLENLDNDDYIGAYAVAVFKDGTKKVDVMTSRQIQTSFEQSYAKGKSEVHKRFKQSMFNKTIINRLLKTVIGSSDDSNLYEDTVKPTTKNLVEEEIEDNANSELIDFEEAEEVIEEKVEESKNETTTPEPKEGKKTAMQPSIDF